MKPRIFGLLLLFVNVALLACGIALLLGGGLSQVSKGIWIFNVILNGIMVIPNAKLAFAR